MDQKIIEKLKELEQMIIDSYEDIEEEPPTTLDRQKVKKYEEILQEIFKICKEENIKDMEQFNEKYPSLHGIEDFVEDFLDAVYYTLEYEETYLDLEIKILNEIMECFELNDDLKQEYELTIIRDTHTAGREKVAEKQLDEWIKKHPTIGEGYEIKCDWELEKDEPDMEKIADILNEAEENDTFVDNDYIYEEVIDYAEKIGDDEMADYFESLLEFKQAQDVNFDEEMYLLEEKQGFNGFIRSTCSI